MPIVAPRPNTMCMIFKCPNLHLKTHQVHCKFTRDAKFVNSLLDRILEPLAPDALLLMLYSHSLSRFLCFLGAPSFEITHAVFLLLLRRFKRSERLREPCLLKERHRLLLYLLDLGAQLKAEFSYGH